MNNLDCTKTILEAHREARAWDDSAVAGDLLNQLGLDPMADAKNPKPVVDPEETEVATAEAEAKAAADKAKSLRAKLDAKGGPAKKPLDGATKPAAPETQGPHTPAADKVVLPPSTLAPSPMQATPGATPHEPAKAGSPTT